MAGQKSTVLVVDDEADLCLILEKILTRTYLVDVVNNLKDAASYLKTHRPSHIFLDNNLPDGLGIDFLTQLRISDKSVYVIMMTAQNAKTLEITAVEKGADLFLKKPFSLSVVNDAMRQLAGIR